MDISSFTRQEKVQMNPTAGRLMLTVFWDSQGLLLEHYQERGSTVNSAHNSEVLCDKLKPAIQSKQRGLLSAALCCYTTMPVLTLLPTLLKPFRNYVLWFWSIAHIVLTLSLWIVTRLVHLNKP